MTNHATPRINTEKCGQCDWPIQSLTVPVCYQGKAWREFLLWKSAIHARNAGCPCWTAKEQGK